MNRTSRYALACMLGTPGALLAHPGHAPGEPEHWVIAVLFAIVGLSVGAMLRRQRNTNAPTRKSGERE